MEATWCGIEVLTQSRAPALRVEGYKPPFSELLTKGVVIVLRGFTTPRALEDASNRKSIHSGPESPRNHRAENACF